MPAPATLGRWASTRWPRSRGSTPAATSSAASRRAMTGASPIVGAARAMLAAAETAYTRGDWAGALPLYRTFAALHPAAAEQALIALALGHCEIELGMGFDPARPARLHD